MTTGFVCEERFFWHDAGNAPGWLRPGKWLEPHVHVETASSKRRVRNLLDVSGLLAQLTPIGARPATDAELGAVHLRGHIDAMHAQDESGGDMGDGTLFSPDGEYIARLAAGGVVEAVNAVVRGDVDNAYCLVRPPGHHATRAGGGGFCMYNNLAVGVSAALKLDGIERVAVIDYDVHHGNGTQDIFWDDPRVLTVSIHQDRVYPLDQGFHTESGSEQTAPLSAVNIPLPGGAGTGAYEYAFERVIEPAVRRFDPDLIVVASGFDGNGFDSMARIDLHSESYRSIAKRILRLAADLTGGRVVFVHEGGYSEFYTPFCAHAVIEELRGVRTEIVDPYLEGFIGRPGQELLDHQQAAIDATAKHHGLHPA